MPKSRARTILKASGITKQVTTGNTELTILSGVSFEVGAGEAVAIVGVSGSGKSTLLGLLAGLDTPSAGLVDIDGQALFALDEDGRAALRGQMLGFVFQSFQLLPAMTALENVMLPLELAGAIDPQAPAQAMLARVGLGDRLHHYPKQLSGGEQQRVAIARAIVTDPEIVVADEPTGDLDAKNAVEVLSQLRDLRRAFRKTVVMVTHDPRGEAYVDEIHHLDKGVLVDTVAGGAARAGS
jgi:putative ABC transport system ATP-binding protein